MNDYRPYYNPHMYMDKPNDKEMMVFIMKKPEYDEYEKPKMVTPEDYCDQSFDMGTVYDYMDKPMQKYSHVKYPMKSLVEQVKDCALTCHEMANLMAYKDCDKRCKQIKLLHDCARICDLLTVYLATNSIFSKQLAHLCGLVCETCGNECLKYPDKPSQHCAKICLDCAKSCYEYARM